MDNTNYRAFVVRGEPQGKGRSRMNTRTHVAYTPKATRDYERDIVGAYRKQCGDLSPIPRGIAVEVTLIAYYKIPKSASKRDRGAMQGGKKRPTKKPDADNVIKVICDALNGLAYYDDSQVVRVTLEKFYTAEPRVEVYIREMML